MKLEEQLATLAEMGLTLNDGVTIDDLLYSFPRAKFEAKPFHHLLFLLGVEVEREPRGRAFCDRVYKLYSSGIGRTGSYVRIVQRLALVANRASELTQLRDSINRKKGEAWLEYTISGKSRRWTVELRSDWVDMMVLSYVMDDLERDGKKFRARDNGQSKVLYYLDDAAAQKIGEFLGTPLTNMVVA